MRHSALILFITVALMIHNGCSQKLLPEFIDDTPASFGDNTAFRDWCVSMYDLDGDGVLTMFECSKVREVTCQDLTLFSLEGIKNFKNAEAIYCYGNVLDDLDVSGMSSLKYLYCNNANVHQINLSGCSSLLILDAHYNFISKINISDCPEIFLLSVCFNSSLSKLDLSSNKKLGTIYCQQCSLEELDFSGCNKVVGIHCWNNKLRTLILDGCESLTDLWCGDNNLNTLDISTCPDKMEYISCPRNPNLVRIYMRKNQTAASIELSPNTGILYK